MTDAVLPSPCQRAWGCCSLSQKKGSLAGAAAGEVLEGVARLGTRLILQTALEAEVGEFLGRDRYACGDRARAGSRNGIAVATGDEQGPELLWTVAGWERHLTRQGRRW